jgi:hypothetical protein
MSKNKNTTVGITGQSVSVGYAKPKQGMDRSLDKIGLIMKIDARCTCKDMERFLDTMDYKTMNGIK